MLKLNSFFFAPVDLTMTHTTTVLASTIKPRRWQVWVLAVWLLSALSACQDAQNDPEAQAHATGGTNLPVQSVTVAAIQQDPALVNPDNLVEKSWPTTYRAAMPGSSVIPYPLYPNATKYRVGGEHGLKIVVFETTDSFGTVDRYFQNMGEGGLNRLDAMQEYVRYASEQDDQDPWGTHRPGIVIHQFAGIDEATSVGAAPESITNIIMSYR